MVNTSAGLLGLAATLFGIPLGLLLTKSLLEIISASYGFGTMSVSPNLLYLACLVPLVVIVSVFGSLLPGRWAARLSIVRVLSSE